MKKLLALSALLLSLVGCASVPMGDPAMDAKLKQFQVSPDKSAIYIYRNETMGTAVKMDVAIDGQPIGQTVANTYLYKEVTPGKHVITSEAENTSTLEVDAKPGSAVYVWQEVKMGVLFARNKLQEVSPAEGQAGVRETELAVGQ
ncbi:DUF2846 domain-containing protein [Atopomonas hussainii]|uniref:DUF2846 domain-containing protein n=1 Tax=Atopomonas hussainii TaxID=1429083 RepID=UPI0009000341|nr:DUF2846 domain-containing protein [Atopomonas hussainii]